MKDAAWYNKNKTRALEPLEKSATLPLWEAQLEMLPGDCGRVLDLGCGTGRFARLFETKRGGRYIGVDFASELIDAAREYNPCMEFICRDIFDCADLIAEADTIMLSEVLEHIDNDTGLLAMIPAGKKILASVPNFNSAAHVRTFTELAGVKQRYGHGLHFTAARRVRLIPGKWWTVFYGVKT